MSSYADDNSSDIILNRMKSNISSNVDSTEGSFVHDALAPASIELNECYKTLDEVTDKLDISNLHDDELDTRIYELTGLSRNLATYAIVTLTANGSGVINEGDLFQTPAGIQFAATQTVTITNSGTFVAKALVAGSSGMLPAGQITIIPVVIPGIISITNAEATINGFDKETDEHYLQRYYDKVREPATQGNIYQLKNLMESYAGVGDVKVFPTWNGNQTVKLIFIDSNNQVPSSDLVNEVQTYMDPLGDSWGQGYGAAPYGCFTTVTGAVAKNINVSFTAVKDTSNYTDDQIKANVEASIIAYLQSIAFAADSVSYAKLGAAILASAGILDYSNLTVNNQTGNVSLSYTVSLTECPMMGSVTIA